MRSFLPVNLVIGCRNSPLSLAQFGELSQELSQVATHIQCFPFPLKTIGDQDRKTSLRNLDKTDFFTREIDQLQLQGAFRAAVHSAKDLPDPLPSGLCLAALTRGVDSSDSLVFREGEDLHTLARGAKVATSSARRDQIVKKLRGDLSIVDIRGNIGERLSQLQTRAVDALVVAEAALIRLGLTHLPRMRLPGETAPLQGKLAVVVRQEDEEMKLLFSLIDTRPLKRILYCGLDPSFYRRSLADNTLLFHYPVIRIHSYKEDPHVQQSLSCFSSYTHILFTSKTAVHALLEVLDPTCLKSLKLFAVGQATASCLLSYGLTADRIAQEETAEGMVALLDQEPLHNAHLFWPHSTLARAVIPQALSQRSIAFTQCHLYEPKTHVSFLPSLDRIDQIVLTSPSVAKGFQETFGSFPSHKEFLVQGPVTLAHMRSFLPSSSRLTCL